MRLLLSFILMIEVCMYSFHIPKFHHKSSIQIKYIHSSTKLFESKGDGVEVVPTLLPGDDRLQSIELSDELKNSFMSYAMSTILGRCLPDARDGLKPVHRRVLYAMHALGLGPDSGYRKCARVVGEVLGKFHPHGDQSVYDALVRMAQDFVMLHPLIRGHGNFGSTDDDPPAAMRYTECKLSSVAEDTLLADIKEDTVDFIPNFDGNEHEPLYLPARLPMLVLNGASGIAVGMATNIPPHNLGEIADAVVALIKNPAMTMEELSVIVPAPDFPTGGKILGAEGSKQFHHTGKGAVVLRAKCHNEVITAATKAGIRTRNAIVITELPYMANKASLLEKIADLVNDKKIDGIADLRDESDRDGTRVVIELKRDAEAAVVQNNLFKKTGLQTSFPANMLALVDNGTQPQRITLLRSLEIFVQFRFETIRRRSKYRLIKVENRDHLVIGLISALERIDDVIDLLRTSKDTAQARAGLMSSKYNLTEVQADAILGLRLGRLTSMEVKKLKEEHKELTQQIKQLKGIMEDDAQVRDIIIAETLEIKAKHAVPRRSIIWTDEGPLSDEDLLANDRSVIILTSSGYVKRLPIEEFEAQSRGGKGKAGTKMASEEDKVQQFFSCNDHDKIMFITDKGISYSVKAHQIPFASRTAKGSPLPQVLPIGQDEKVTTVIPVTEFKEDEFLVLLTVHGYVKKTPLQAFKSITARGLIIIGLEDGDSLRWARICKSDEDILIATKDGFATRFSAADMQSTGRTARGVRALNLRDGDKMCDMDILKSNDIDIPQYSYVLMVTEKGYGKRVPIDEFRQQKRNGKGSTAIKFKEKAGGGGIGSRKLGKVSEDPDALSCMRICHPGDELVISTERGNIIRQRVDDLSVQSRTATGVLIQKLDKDDVIVMVDILPPQHVGSSGSHTVPETIAVIEAVKDKPKKPSVSV